MQVCTRVLLDADEVAAESAHVSLGEEQVRWTEGGLRWSARADASANAC